MMAVHTNQISSFGLPYGNVKLDNGFRIYTYSKWGGYTNHDIVLAVSPTGVMMEFTNLEEMVKWMQAIRLTGL